MWIIALSQSAVLRGTSEYDLRDTFFWTLCLVFLVFCVVMDVLAWGGWRKGKCVVRAVKASVVYKNKRNRKLFYLQQTVLENLQYLFCVFNISRDNHKT